MDGLCKKLMLGGSMAAMLAAISASAGAQEQQSENVESVTVSASRINIQGYEAPTPVTVIGAETLQRDAKWTSATPSASCPRWVSPTRPATVSTRATPPRATPVSTTIDLRSLGVIRTLILFDGQRVVSSNPNVGGPPAIGGVDLSDHPHQPHPARGRRDRRRFGRLGLRRCGRRGQSGRSTRPIPASRPMWTYGNSTNNDFEKYNWHGDARAPTCWAAGRIPNSRPPTP